MGDDAPLEGGTEWRCMNGEVYACYIGANIPCESKADLNEEPTEPMDTYCAENPDAEEIPTLVVGRTTVFAWGCSGSSAERQEQIEEVDEAGYIKRYWSVIPAPAN